MRCCKIKEYHLLKLLNNPDLIDEGIRNFLKSETLFKQDVDLEEIKGHISKSDHNLRFVAENKLNFPDWAMTGCYYASYHAALALIQTKGYTSKNHLATLYVIIKEFYKKELTEEDIKLLCHFLDYRDILFYVESKNKREDATYSTKTLFNKYEVEKLRIQSIMFVNKIKDIINLIQS